MYQRLQGSSRLKRIAELAGRLERIAANKARSKVKPGVGEVHGIGLGGLADLARLLPSELVALRRPARRLGRARRLRPVPRLHAREPALLRPRLLGPRAGRAHLALRQWPLRHRSR
jgi:hypothetical protein